MHVIRTAGELLEHIKTVEAEVMELSGESQLRISAFMQKNGIAPDDDTIEAMQYQDIISQQLSATVAAIGTLQECLNAFDDALRSDDKTGLENTEMKLRAVLEEAKEKHSGFGGKIVHHEDDDGIEFF